MDEKMNRRDWRVVCAERMTKTLAKKPNLRASREYLKTLPKRHTIVVSPTEFELKTVASSALQIERQPKVRKDRVLKRGHTASNKMKLFWAQDGLCGSCGLAFSSVSEATFDHVTPKSQGGSNAITNLLLMHAECNNRKGSMMPTQYELSQNCAKNSRLAE